MSKRSKNNENEIFNFTNILQSAFSYESNLESFSVLRVCVCTFFGERQDLAKMLPVGEMD